MQNYKEIFLIVVLFNFFNFCCIENSGNLNAEENLTLSIVTDKESYHPKEKMNISVKINSSIFIEDVNLRVYGIYAKGNYKIDSTKNVVLYPGKREVLFEFITPECYGCSGISPGIYNISVELIRAREILKRDTKNLRIEQ